MISKAWRICELCICTVTVNRYADYLSLTSFCLAVHWLIDDLSSTPAGIRG